MSHNQAYKKLVVTGSIAFDYLMSFPGKFTDHFIQEHMSRVSLSFLVSERDAADLVRRLHLTLIELRDAEARGRLE